MGCMQPYDNVNGIDGNFMLAEDGGAPPTNETMKR